MADPFYQRPLGLNETMAAAFQMRLYLEKSGVGLDHCGRVAAKNLGNALRNPYADRKGPYTVDEILGSEPVVDPLTDLMVGPKSEGFVAVLLASEKKARKMCDRPVWIEGYGCAVDTYTLGDRDLTAGQLPNAARQAYKQAGVDKPAQDVDLAEITEPYAYMELMWAEQLGLCEPGQAVKMLDKGVFDIDGDLPVNPSGGTLATNPYVSRGLARTAECVLQMRGQAGEHQVDKNVKRALAHGTHGPAGACHAVAVLGR
jgi:acetyl-CoA C-acetyltransferase